MAGRVLALWTPVHLAFHQTFFFLRYFQMVYLSYIDKSDAGNCLLFTHPMHFLQHLIFFLLFYPNSSLATASAHPPSSSVWAASTPQHTPHLSTQFGPGPATSSEFRGWRTSKIVLCLLKHFWVMLTQIYMENDMRRILTLVLLGASLFSFAGCSSYPSWVPEWAQIGAEKTAE